MRRRMSITPDVTWFYTHQVHCLIFDLFDWYLATYKFCNNLCKNIQAKKYLSSSHQLRCTGWESFRTPKYCEQFCCAYLSLGIFFAASDIIEKRAAKWFKYAKMCINVRISLNHASPFWKSSEHQGQSDRSNAFALCCLLSESETVDGFLPQLKTNQRAESPCVSITQWHTVFELLTGLLDNFVGG